MCRVDSGHGADVKITVLVKVTLSLYMPLRHVVGSRGIVPLIHNLSTR